MSQAWWSYALWIVFWIEITWNKLKRERNPLPQFSPPLTHEPSTLSTPLSLPNPTLFLAAFSVSSYLSLSLSLPFPFVYSLDGCAQLLPPTLLSIEPSCSSMCLALVEKKNNNNKKWTNSQIIFNGEGPTQRKMFYDVYMPGVGLMVRVVCLGFYDPEFKSCSAVELIPGGVDSAYHPSEVGKMSVGLLVSCVGVAIHPGLCPLAKETA